MNWLNIIAVAVALAMDAFAVSIAAGLSVERLTRRHVLRVAIYFGFFQFMMTVLGWMAGRSIAEYIHPWDDWVAFGLLMSIGGKMLWDSRRDNDKNNRTDPTRGWMLVVLSIATSIDALAVGLSMGLLNVAIFVPSVVIGVVTAAMSTVGICFGSKLGRRFERWASIVGGIVLIAIGIRILACY